MPFGTRPLPTIRRSQVLAGGCVAERNTPPWMRLKPWCVAILFTHPTEIADSQTGQPLFEGLQHLESACYLSKLSAISNQRHAKTDVVPQMGRSDGEAKCRSTGIRVVEPMASPDHTLGTGGKWATWVNRGLLLKLPVPARIPATRPRASSRQPR